MKGDTCPQVALSGSGRPHECSRNVTRLQRMRTHMQSSASSLFVPARARRALSLIEPDAPKPLPDDALVYSTAQNVVISSLDPADQ